MREKLEKDWQREKRKEIYNQHDFRKEIKKK